MARVITANEARTPAMPGRSSTASPEQNHAPTTWRHEWMVLEPAFCALIQAGHQAERWLH